MGNSKSASAMIRRTRNFITLLGSASLLAMVASNTAYAVSAGALPQGGNVVGGSATFSNPTSTSLDVNQSSERAVINWNTFNVGQSASVQFNVPNAQGLTVNRVVNSSSDPTQILGSLSSNGQVMILD